MVTTFNAKDMTSFAAYVLSKKRTNLIKSNYKEDDNIPLEERLMQVYHADFENWKFEQESKKKIKEKIIVIGSLNAPFLNKTKWKK